MIIDKETGHLMKDLFEDGDSVAAIKNALLFASYKIGYMGTSNGFMTTEQVQQWRNLIWGVR